jgi:hypothetical protein
MLQPAVRGSTHRLEEVARSICSSKAPFAEEPNQPAMVSERIVCSGGGVWLTACVRELCAGSLELLVQDAVGEGVGERRCRRRCL